MTTLGFVSFMARVACFWIFGGLRAFVNVGTLGAVMIGTHPTLPWLPYMQHMRANTNPLIDMVSVYAYTCTRIHVFVYMCIRVYTIYV